MAKVRNNTRAQNLRTHSLKIQQVHDTNFVCGRVWVPASRMVQPCGAVLAYRASMSPSYALRRQGVSEFNRPSSWSVRKEERKSYKETLQTKKYRLQPRPQLRTSRFRRSSAFPAGRESSELIGRLVHRGMKFEKGHYCLRDSFLGRQKKRPRRPVPVWQWKVIKACPSSV